MDYIQLREKDLNASELGSIAEEILTGLDRSKSKLLLNMPASSPLLEAVAAVADGVHIPGQARRGTVGLVRQIFQAIGRPAIVSMACHSVEDAEIAQAEGADLALFAPVFEKPAGEKSDRIGSREGPERIGAGLRGGSRHTGFCAGWSHRLQCPGVPCGRGRRGRGDQAVHGQGLAPAHNSAGLAKMLDGYIVKKGLCPKS